MSKKKKKIIKELKRHIKRNKDFCEHNNCEPTEYINGVNDLAKIMIKFIKNI
jgi:hypothetical protein